MASEGSEVASSEVRILYGVSYTRRGDSNKWTAKTSREQIIRDATTSGAIRGTRGEWFRAEGDDADHRTVGVYLKADPLIAAEHAIIDPNLWLRMADQARTLADQQFKAEFPDAEITHIVKDED